MQEQAQQKRILTGGIAQKLLTILVVVVTVLTAILPMSLSPTWNGEKPAHRNQYEMAARAFLEGHLDLDYGEVDSRLLSLENPYNPSARKKSGASFKWDHAFYNGRYYMYFGVVPVVVLFLPYRAITGNDLTTYHATQIFTAAFIVGLFLFFALLRKRFFKRMNLAVSLALSAAISLMSVWYASAAPALYCTAITAGLAMEIWSLWFFFKAVYDTESENKAVFLAGVGALFGALAFGCRPPVALANLIVIPLLIAFIKQRKVSLRLIGKLVLAALPYAVVGGLLMWYNYARFGNVLEFGQSYQLTIADVSHGVSLNAKTIWKGLVYYLVKAKVDGKLVALGAFITFPVLFLFILPWFRSGSRKLLRHEFLLTWIFLAVTPFLVVLLDIAGSPVLLPRYRTDFTWLFGLFAFTGIGFFAETLRKKAVFNAVVLVFAAAAIVMSFVLFFYPYDGNFASYLAK